MKTKLAYSYTCSLNVFYSCTCSLNECFIEVAIAFTVTSTHTYDSKRLYPIIYIAR
jgi:hypothetical protein